MEQNIYRIPAHYVCALVNGDFSALNDEEEKELCEWIDRVQPGHCTIPDDEPFFCHANSINSIGDNCYDAIFIK